MLITNASRLGCFFCYFFLRAESCAEGLIIYFKLTMGYVTTSRPQVHIYDLFVSNLLHLGFLSISKVNRYHCVFHQ